MSRIALMLGLLLPGLAWAEGSEDTNVNTTDAATAQILDARTDAGTPNGGFVFTQVYVDVLSANEVIHFDDHEGSLNLFNPSGAQVGTNMAAGSTYTAPSTGAYRVEYSQDQVDWDIWVSNPGPDPGFGRVWSRAWHFDAQTFNAQTTGTAAQCYECRVWSSGWSYPCSGCDGRTYASFYALVDGGGVGRNGVVEMKTDGLAGFIYLIAANRAGMTGANGRSVPQDSRYPSVQVEYPVYLNPPEISTFNPLVPVVTNASFEYDAACDQVAEDVADGDVVFDSNAIGTYHITCDIGGDPDDGGPDGVFDFTSDDDVHLLGQATAGTLRVTWDGTDNRGDPVPAGTYDCQVFVTVGEFHYVGGDMESSYLGFRLFKVEEDLDRVGRPMFWNDEEVTDDATLQPDGEYPRISSGPQGVDSQTYYDPTGPTGDAPVPTQEDDYDIGNARSWGNFNTNSPPAQCGVRIPGTTGNTLDDFYHCSKGDWSWLDTYTWLEQSDPLEFQITVGSVLDGDGDNLLDAEEECLYGTDPTKADTDGDGLDDDVEVLDLPTDPTNPDSDGDGIPDDVEVGDPDNPTNTDGDSLINAMDPDDDNDTVPTAEETYDGDDDPTNDNTDGPSDDIPDYLDTDDDGDGIPTKDEDANGNGDPTDDDADGDGTPDYLEPDADNDGILDGVEGTIDTDSDGKPDYADPDDDNDGIPTIEEKDEGDTDSDGKPDHLDPDDDDDGIPTIDEGGFADDEDDDGTPNHQDLDSDGDGILDEIEGNVHSDDDGKPDFLDTDSDDDTVLDEIEGTKDTDDDELPDYTDPDDDGDHVPTAEEDYSDGEGGDADGDPTNDNTDADEANGDTDPDYLDPDDDADGIPTATEYDDGQEFGEDVDGDGHPNWVDTDADGDGVLDEDEGTSDTDNDGVPNYLDPDGLYEVYYTGSCLLSTGGAAPGGAAGWLLALLAAATLRRRRGGRGMGALALGLAAGLAVAAPAHALDAPEISRSVGSPKQVIVLWPRIVPLNDEVAALAPELQARLVTLVGEAAPDKPLNVRPEPQRVCPIGGGCKAPSVGVLLAHYEGGCAAVAMVSAPGESPAKLVPWAGVVELKAEEAEFRKPPEEQLTIKDFVPCDSLLDEVQTHRDVVLDALRTGL